MNFVSYAQNFEDVLLRRALHDVEAGNYLDIGAQDPVVDSVSYTFYQVGWRGIHVEATPAYAARLREARPDEIVIEAAVTDAPGPIEFYEIPDTGLSTGKKQIAAIHADNGLQTRMIVVPCVRLDQLLETAAPNLHWMKVDVEGMEAEVLRSWGQSPVRPWVLIVESTFPNTQRPTQHPWQREVLDRGYREVFYDGLSRYFLHEAHADRASRFEAPANIFDAFSVARHHFSAAYLRGELEAVEQRVEDHSAEINRLHGEVTSTTERLLREQQERESALRVAHEKKLDNALKRERQLAEEEFRRKETALRETLRKAEAETASSRIALARLEERSDRLRERLANTQNALLRAQDDLSEAHQNIGSLELELEELQARSDRQAAEDRVAMARVEGLIDSVLAEAPGRWQRLGEALGLAKPSKALQALDRWSQSQPRGQADFAGLANTDQTGLTMQTQASTEAQDPPSGASSLAELLSANGDDFVELAYLTLLGRAADPEGKAYYAGRLARGHSKVEILDQLRRSDEGKGRPAVGEIDAALRQFRTSCLIAGKRRAGAAIEHRIMRETAQVSVNHFMRYHDEEFVAQLFAFYLGRQSDEAGMAHYLGLIRSGISRQQVLLDVARSSEARALGRKALGERRIAAALTIDRIPVLGTLAAIIRFNLNLKAHMRELRAFQNHLYRLTKNLH